MSIDTTVKTINPWCRTYKKPLNCNSGDWSWSSPPPCALAMSCNLDLNQATNLNDNSKQGVSCLANRECRLITSQSVHYHSSYHQLKYLKLKNKSSLLCCWHSVLTDKNHPSFKQYKLWLWVISKALVQYTMLWRLSFYPWAVCLMGPSESVNGKQNNVRQPQ